MSNTDAFDASKAVSPNVITALKPVFEYVSGKNLLNTCKLSGNMGIGKFDPVIDSCKTINAKATKRPILLPTAIKKKIIDINVILTKMANNINSTTFVTASCSTTKTKSDTNNACIIANSASFNHLLTYQLIADDGLTAGFLKSIKKDKTNILTNNASDKIYGAVESR